MAHSRLSRVQFALRVSIEVASVLCLIAIGAQITATAMDHNYDAMREWMGLGMLLLIALEVRDLHDTTRKANRPNEEVAPSHNAGEGK